MMLIGNDFIERISPRDCVCSECGEFIRQGQTQKVSIRNGKVKKILCTKEDCRLEFDARIWDDIARKNASRRKKKC
jgi:hypothetical protein